VALLLAHIGRLQQEDGESLGQELGHEEDNAMVLLRAGHFRELSDGDPSGPSLEESRDKLPQELRPRAAQYLCGGSVWVTTGRLVDDWFDGTPGIAPQEIRTDGEWLWPGHYAYYVKKYGVDIPQEFLDHMARQGWIAPELTEAKMRKVVEQIHKQFGN
jgi:hypothetical protein